MSDIHCSSEALACSDRSLWRDVLNDRRLLDKDSECAADPWVWRWRLRFCVRQPRRVQVHVRGVALARQVRGREVVHGCTPAVRHPPRLAIRRSGSCRVVSAVHLMRYLGRAETRGRSASRARPVWLAQARRARAAPASPCTSRARPSTVRTPAALCCWGTGVLSCRGDSACSVCPRRRHPRLHVPGKHLQCSGLAWHSLSISCAQKQPPHFHAIESDTALVGRRLHRGQRHRRRVDLR